jgi:acetyl esterase/lipase
MITTTLDLYENRHDVTLTTYLLADSPEMLNGKKRPGVLICPGGAYLGCSDREAEPVALRFAAMGYHAFVLRYSTYFSGQFGEPPAVEDMPVNPKSVHPAPVRDIGKAFLTIREHADEWLLDMKKIALCGFSAGGHNCAMYSVYWNKPLITDHFGKDAALFKPAAALIGYSLTDYHLTIRQTYNPVESKIRQAAAIALLGTVEPDDALLTEVSPTHHVTAETPPTFIWATAADTLVPVEHSTRMATSLAKAGVPFEVHIFEEGMHGLSLADQATANSQIQIDKDAAKWMPLAEAWLKKRFAFSLPEKPAWMAMMENNNNEKRMQSDERI